MIKSPSSFENIEVLITVKAYPNPSKSIGEASCIAGIRRDRQLVRLYPMPIRDFDGERAFKKFQWIRLSVKKPNNDARPETFRPDIESIQLLPGQELDTKNGWKARCSVVMPLVSDSLCDIQDAQKSDGTSLGIFKPEEVIDFVWEEEENTEWKQGELEKLGQRDLFLTKEKRLLEKIPYSFSYIFRCKNCRTNKPHKLKIVDWELMQLFRNQRRKCVTIEECLKKVKMKWFDEMCGPQKDTCFFVGNMSAHPASFLVLGVFWPPVMKQLDLL